MGEPVPRSELTDAQVAKASSLVRGLVAQRLELLWQQVERAVLEAQEEGDRVDPRLIQQGVGVLDRMARVWRLDERVPDEPEKDEAGKRRQLVDRALAELEVLEGR